jgi:uncharacterized protein (TIGR03435 family)
MKTVLSGVPRQLFDAGRIFNCGRRKKTVSMKMGLALARRTACAAFLAILATACPAFAQAPPPPPPQAQPAASPRDIVGIWQGTLHIAQANRDLRIVNKITKDDKGALKVMDYSIDQSGQGFTATSASFEDGVLKYSIDPIGGKYEGKISADGKTITGAWTQGPAPIALNLDRANADTAWVIPQPPKTMPADANPGIDVATVKPSKPDQPGKLFTFRGRSLVTINTTMNDLITFAYGLHTKQIIGAPDWFGNDKFDVDLVPDIDGRPSLSQMRSLLQKLLAERFKLTFHNERRELSAYIIAVTPSGAKMKVTAFTPTDPPGFMFGGLGDLRVTNMDMKEFAKGMQSAVMDKPVVDQTELKDRYDFSLKWTPDDSQFAAFRGPGQAPPKPPDDPNAPPSLYTAIQEQIGIKITPGKAQDDVIVIDHVEKPTAN